MARTSEPGELVVNNSKVKAALRSQSLGKRKTMRLEVGFRAPYAVYVHEDLEARHRVGRAKYLEIAARRFAPTMRAIIRRSIRAKNGLAEGMMRAGRLLLEEAKKRVPVDTGFLRDSGYVRVR